MYTEPSSDTIQAEKKNKKHTITWTVFLAKYLFSACPGFVGDFYWLYELF